jgi:hypothetical protein
LSLRNFGSAIEAPGIVDWFAHRPIGAAPASAPPVRR